LACTNYGSLCDHSTLKGTAKSWRSLAIEEEKLPARNDIAVEDDLGDGV
jgi:hypothetical protein